MHRGNAWDFIASSRRVSVPHSCAFKPKLGITSNVSFVLAESTDILIVGGIGRQPLSEAIGTQFKRRNGLSAHVQRPDARASSLVGQSIEGAENRTSGKPRGTCGYGECAGHELANARETDRRGSNKLWKKPQGAFAPRVDQVGQEEDSLATSLSDSKAGSRWFP
jgi:hypothetical protein